MKPTTSFCVAAAILSLAAGMAFAQEKPPKATPNTGGISMKSVEFLAQKGIGPELIGGRPANTADWPASFYSASEGGRCTATLVGPRALLLAAHCVGNGKDVTIQIVGGNPISGRCTHAPQWKDGNGDDSADYALCRLSEEVANIPLETVNLDPMRLKKGENLVLTGYGCTQPPGTSGLPTGGNDGIYRIGEAPIVKLPGEPGNEPNTILTRHSRMICPGDSGGGAYIGSSSDRVLVSVNSRVLFSAGESYLSSLSTSDGIGFLKQWIADNNDEKICGVNLKGTRCR
jgi:hypothetical protein